MSPIPPLQAMAQPPNKNALQAHDPDVANVLPPHLYNPYQQVPYYPIPYAGQHLQQYAPQPGNQGFYPPPAFPGNLPLYPPLPALQGHAVLQPG